MTLILISTLTFSLVGCSETSIDPIIENLQLDIIILDRHGNEKYNFDSEADITLVLRATNNLKDTLELGKYYSFCHLPNIIEDFFMVYKATQFNELIPIGRPFDFPVYCIDMYSPVFVPPNSEISVYKARWLDNPNNSPLESGRYFSAFTINIAGKTFYPEVSFTIAE